MNAGSGFRSVRNSYERVVLASAETNRAAEIAASKPGQVDMVRLDHGSHARQAIEDLHIALADGRALPQHVRDALDGARSTLGSAEHVDVHTAAQRYRDANGAIEHGRAALLDHVGLGADDVRAFDASVRVERNTGKALEATGRAIDARRIGLPAPGTVVHDADDAMADLAANAHGNSRARHVSEHLRAGREQISIQRTNHVSGGTWEDARYPYAEIEPRLAAAQGEYEIAMAHAAGLKRSLGAQLS